MDIDKQEAKSLFEKMKVQAREIINDPRRMKDLLAHALVKSRDAGREVFGDAWDSLMTMLRLIKAVTNGTYTGFPVRSLVMVVAGVLYFVTPFDVIPDFIPIIGFLDDVFVLTLVITAVGKDLRVFERWEKSHAGHSPRRKKSPEPRITRHA